MSEKTYEQIDSATNTKPDIPLSSQIHTLFILKVINMQTYKEGWRIVALWGDEAKGEGYKIGPLFEENQLEECEKTMDEIHAKVGLPCATTDLINYLLATYP
jgi:hypothetical protein